MNIARVLYPVRVLGPGDRIGIWTCGCPRRCQGCSNPELWKQKEEYEITVDELLLVLNDSFKGKTIDGFVITGGEPFSQPDDLAELLSRIKNIADDILVYSGYTYQELLSLSNPSIVTCLNSISVLIDGEYIERLNANLCLRGSSNQNIVYLDSNKKTMYEEYCLTPVAHSIQNFQTKDGIISVGIHRPNFSNELISNANRKGVSLKNG